MTATAGVTESPRSRPRSENAALCELTEDAYANAGVTNAIGGSTHSLSIAHSQLNSSGDAVSVAAKLEGHKMGRPGLTDMDEVRRRVTLITARVDLLSPSLKPDDMDQMVPGRSPFESGDSAAEWRPVTPPRPRRPRAGVSPAAAVRHLGLEWNLLQSGKVVARVAGAAAALQIVLTVATTIIRSSAVVSDELTWYDILTAGGTVLATIQVACVVWGAQLHLRALALLDPLLRRFPLMTLAARYELLAEVLVLALHEPVLLRFQVAGAHKLAVLAMMRAYLLLKALCTYSTQAGGVAASLARYRPGLLFELRILYLLRPAAAVGSAWAAGLLVGAFALYVLEDCSGASWDCSALSFGDACWLAWITMTTVGYGDLYPHTALGKVAACALTLYGVACIALAVSWVADSVHLSGKQRKLAEFLVSASRRREVERLAARIIGLKVLNYFRKRRGPGGRELLMISRRGREVVRLCSRFRRLRRELALALESLHDPGWGEEACARLLSSTEERILTAMAAERSAVPRRVLRWSHENPAAPLPGGGDKTQPQQEHRCEAPQGGAAPMLPPGQNSSAQSSPIQNPLAGREPQLTDFLMEQNEKKVPQLPAPEQLPRPQKLERLPTPTKEEPLSRQAARPVFLRHTPASTEPVLPGLVPSAGEKGRKSMQQRPSVPSLDVQSETTSSGLGPVQVSATLSSRPSGSSVPGSPSRRAAATKQAAETALQQVANPPSRRTTGQSEDGALNASLDGPSGALAMQQQLHQINLSLQSLAQGMLVLLSRTPAVPPTAR
eukprot:TRINITY_DN19263_c0_g1_i1.p1 TRINITY_DN19263_c0_g1~~TRINITY_DN19263_c0_g1_i1.p1  ORF type:complete len:822 (+),score=152.69 TRINITY_DN19263_c0_g1_i1:115-2466(+)